MNNGTKNSTLRNFLLLVSIFFFWGFIAAANSILIAFCKVYFSLSQLASQFIETAFYGAYFYGLLLLYIFSFFLKYDIINKIGYKTGLIIGLAIATSGALLLYIFTGIEGISFVYILSAFFIIGIGFSLQQSIANPLVLLMGHQRTATYRLAFAGGINSIGTLIGPIIVGKIFFVNLPESLTEGSLSIIDLQNLYLILFLIFLLLIILIAFIKIPQPQNHTKNIETGIPTLIILIGIGILLPFIFFVELIAAYWQVSKLIILGIGFALIIGSIIGGYFRAQKKPEKWGSWKYPQVPLGMLAIFFYVGTEVTIPSNFNALFEKESLLQYIALYWGSLLIGRWISTINIFENAKIWKKNIGYFIVGILALTFVFLLSPKTKISELLPYTFFVLFICCVFIYSGNNPIRLLSSMSILGMLTLLLGIFLHTHYEHFFFIASGLCCAVIWPCIFSTSIVGLGAYTSRASSFLIMMILGAAVIAPLQGAVCDMDFKIIGISSVKISYLLPILGFGYLYFYARYIPYILQKQGVQY